MNPRYRLEVVDGRMYRGDEIRETTGGGSGTGRDSKSHPRGSIPRSSANEMICRLCDEPGARWNVRSIEPLCLRCEVWGHHEVSFLALKGVGTPLRRLVMDREGLKRY